LTARFGRIACCVPGCGRGSTRLPGGEFLCQDHYGLTDRALRRLRTRARARLRRLGEWSSGEISAPTSERAARVDGRFWDRLKRQAIERALGIAA
jgi:hypothetical protein